MIIFVINYIEHISSTENLDYQISFLLILQKPFLYFSLILYLHDLDFKTKYRLELDRDIFQIGIYH